MNTLFCFSYAGGVASDVYSGWGALLGPEFTVIPVDYPGRGTRYREPLAATPLELVNDAADVVRDHLISDEAWSVFGHSMGAMVAFEAARVLSGEPEQTKPKIVFLSGRRPPGDSPLTHLPALDDDALMATAETWGGIPPEFLARPQLQPLIVKKLRSDIALSAHPALDLPPLECPLRVLSGTEDPLVDVSQLPRWADVTTQPVSIHLFEGDHFYFSDAVGEVVGVIRDALTSDAPDSQGEPLPVLV